MITCGTKKFSDFTIDIWANDTYEYTEFSLMFFSKGHWIGCVKRRWETDGSMMKHEAFNCDKRVNKKHLIYTKCFIKHFSYNDDIDYWFEFVERISNAKNQFQLGTIIDTM